LLKLLGLAFTLATIPAWPGVTVIDATDRGWVNTAVNNNNGASVGNNYFAGQFLSDQYRNWFEFSIPSFSGLLTSATLQLTQPQPGGHFGDALVYSVYALNNQPMVFTDVTGSVLYGAAVTADNGSGAVIITLDAAALAAIEGDAGQNFFVGGIDSAEFGNSTAYDFGGTGQAYRTLLILTDTAPEPPMAALLLVMMLGLLGWRGRFNLLHRFRSH
jgi:hypothetical protein